MRIRPNVRVLFTPMLTVLALALAPLTARAAGMADWDGRLTLGYSGLMRSGGAGDAKWPSGSLSASVGIDHALRPGWRGGLSLGYRLLGSTTIPRGSFSAGVDYSVVDAAVMLSREFSGRRGMVRVSAGPAILGCAATLSSSGGGAGFSDLAVDDVAAGGALDLLWTSSRPRPVRIGFEAGLRSGFLPDDTWNVVHTGLAILY